MVNLDCQLVPAALLFIFVVLSFYFGCAIGLVSGIATKTAIVLSIQFYKLLLLWFYVDVFLNLEFYYNDAEQCFPNFFKSRFTFQNINFRVPLN